MRIFWLILILCFCAYPSSAQSGPQSTLMPMPSSMRLGTGVLPIDGSFAVEVEGYREPRMDRAVQRFLQDLYHVTGIPMRNQTINHVNATLMVRTDQKQERIPPIMLLFARLCSADRRRPAAAGCDEQTRERAAALSVVKRRCTRSSRSARTIKHCLSGASAENSRSPDPPAPEPRSRNPAIHSSRRADSAL